MGYSVFDETMVDMSWPEVASAAARGAILLLPIGIIEEHGPHMNLAVDTYSACLVAVKARRMLLEKGIETLIAPPQYWGVSKATAVFPGTFSIRPATMQGLIVDIIASLSGWGFKRVFTVNWHADLEHCRAVLAAARQAREETGMDVRYIASEFDMRRLHLAEDEEAVLPQRGAPPLDTGSGPYVDIHAGSMETAVMLRYFPDGMDESFVKKMQPTRLTFEDMKGFGRSDEETRRLIPDGYFGDPAGYDIAAAEAYVEAESSSYAETISGYLQHGN